MMNSTQEQQLEQQQMIQKMKSQTLQLINRLVSASSPSDALESIQSLTSSITSSSSSPMAIENVLSTLTESTEFMKTICILLSESKLQLAHRRMIHVEEGDVTILLLLTAILDCFSKSSSSNSSTQVKKGSKKYKLLAKLIDSFQEQEFHQSLSIIHSLLDIIDNNNNNNESSDSNNNMNVISSSQLFKQSTTISILITLLKLQPTPTINNILQTPHGLNRIIDLFKTSYEDENIVLRNDSIILATELVKLNPGVSKFMIFEDVYDSLMTIVSLEYQAYLSSHNVKTRSENNCNDDDDDLDGEVSNADLLIVKDCLELCIQMTQQERKMGSETFLSNPMTCHVLTMMMDLRNGIYFRDYNLCLYDFEAKGSKGIKGDGSTPYEVKLNCASSEDGLDDILLDSNDTPPGGGGISNGVKEQRGEETKIFPIPYTTIDESKIISSALRLFQLLIQGGSDNFDDETKGSPSIPKISSRVQSIVTSKNTSQLSRLLFDMALYTLPPPNSPNNFYASAVPSINIQCQALSVMADLAKIATKLSIGNDINESPTSNERGSLLQQILDIGCLERVMFLICTGGGVSIVTGDDDEENTSKASKSILCAKKISMHSLGLLRSILTPKEASVMVMHTLVPPTDIDTPLETTNNVKSEPSVVQKLVNTMGENLHILNHPTVSKDLKSIDKERMYINIMGASGALGVFFRNGAGETTREILLRVSFPPPPSSLINKNEDNEDDSNYSLIECIMSYLELGTRSSNGAYSTLNHGETSQDVTLALLRLLMEWVPQCPPVINAILSSANSVSLGFLLQQKSSTTLASQAMTGTLIGLCMEFMGTENDVGGWSTSSIMNLINVGLGVGKFTQLLESLKRIISDVNSKVPVGPWICCEMERVSLLKWYSGNVNIVRRKVVQELSLTSEEDESDTECEDGNVSEKNNNKSLKKLVSHQSAEIETLHRKLSESQDALTAQGSEMNLLKRRIGSNPNKVDDLLDEYSANILLLEIQIKNLKEEIVKANSKNQNILKEQSEEITRMKSELDRCEIEKNQIFIEKESMKNEMSGLSTAYSNLEAEYNRITTNNSSEQAIGDMTAEAGSVSNAVDEALKQENIQLKEDIRNANDWMRQAVRKMEDMGQRNSSLEKDIQKMNRSELSSEVTLHSQKQLNELIAERDMMKSLMEVKQNEVINLNRSLQDVQQQAHIDNNNKAETENLRSEISRIEVNFNNEKKSFAEEIENLQKEISAKNDLIENLKISDGNNRDQQIDKQLEKVQKDNDRLIQANKAAQDWMANAVKHNEKLKKQTEAFKAENAQTKSHLDNAISEKDSDLKNLGAKVDALEKEKRELLENILTIEGELDSSLRDKEIISKENKDLKIAKEDISSELQEISDLKNSLAKEIKMLTCERDGLKEIASRSTDYESKLKAKQEEIDTITTERNELLGTKTQMEADLQHNIDVDNENLKLKESMSQMALQISEIDTLNNRSNDVLNELKNEKEKHIIDTKQLEETIASKDARVAELEEQLNSLKVQSDSSNSKEVEPNTNIIELEEIILTLREENNNLTEHRDEDVGVIEEMESRLHEFQSWTETAQERFDQMEQEKQALEKQITLYDTEKIDSNEKIANASTQIQQLTKELENMKNSSKVNDSELIALRAEVLSLHVEIGHLDGKYRALSEDNKVLEKKNTDLSGKADLLDEVEESLFEKENEVGNLQNKLASLQERLEKLQQKSDETLKNNQEFESTIREKETQLVHQEAEAREALSKWEKRCDTISTDILRYKNERDTMEKTILRLDAQISTYSTSIQELNVALAKEQDEKYTISKQMEDADNVYKVHIEELESAIQEHFNAAEEFESQLDERDEALIQAGEEIDKLNGELVDMREESEDVVSKWQENTQQLEATIAELEGAVYNQGSEANDAITLWEERCHALNEQIAELEQELAKSQNNAGSYSKDLETQLTMKEEEIKELQIQIDHINSRFETKNQEHMNVFNQVKDIQKCLINEQDKLKEKTITLQSLKSEKEILLDDLDNEKTRSEQLKDNLEMETKSNNELERKLRNSKELLEHTKQMLSRSEQSKFDNEQLYEEERNDAESCIQTLEQEKRLLEQSNEIDKAEANEMRLIIGQLENELKEANDMLQSHLTDEVTTRATEMATNALRDQLRESRGKQTFEHEAYLCEKETRILAEEEIDRLKSDLALLLQVEKLADSHDVRMQQLTSKAAGEVLERQRAEINALTKSLEEVMHELQSYQNKEREAEERAANSRLHASACEQELIGAKSNLSLLKESLEILKRDEYQMRITLEHRVKSSDDERATLNLAYGCEIKNLKAEISQGQIERDRLVHALNESEKANTALVYSTSAGHGDDVSSIEVELAKLRLEKAQLLAAVQESRSRAEQRIRSVVNGENEENQGSERKLIVAAEKSLKKLRLKYDETSSQLKLANDSNSELLSRMKDANISGLKNDLYRHENEVMKLGKANEELKSQVKQAKNEAKISKSKLEEKCRLAEAKILELETQERKEAALAAELARVRNETSALGILSYGGSKSESKEMKADDLHDFVLELKEVVKEEREMYQDLLIEHEDLLALLAQQDLEKTSLQAALVTCAGQEAVEKAIIDAEAEAVEQFGKYIKLK